MVAKLGREASDLAGSGRGQVVVQLAGVGDVLGGRPAAGGSGATMRVASNQPSAAAAQHRGAAKSTSRARSESSTLWFSAVLRPNCTTLPSARRSVTTR